MNVQVIGLPCTGKTTAIKKWLQNKKNIEYLDIADHSDSLSLIKRIKQSASRNILVESACGLDLKNSIVILYSQPKEEIYRRHELRKEKLDEDYLSLLESQAIPPNYTVKNPKALFSVLDLLFY